MLKSNRISVVIMLKMLVLAMSPLTGDFAKLSATYPPSV